MKLAHSPTSPYVRKVMVVLHETGQLADVDLHPAHGTPVAPDEALLPKNPLGKVPALERGDGPTLYDSRVICAYLDARAGAGLYLQGAAQWDSLVLEATGDGMMDAALAMTYETRLRPEPAQWPDWVEGQWQKISRACTVLNGRWMSHLAGPLEIGQIAVGCALAYVDFRHGARDWRRGNEALANWHENFVTRPSMKATAPPEGS